MNLVIVESPAKGKTIEKYLGSGYKVVASFGHVRDLPKNKLGVSVEHAFVPDYIIPTKSKKTVANLKTNAKTAESIYLATDNDREGEAIAWHIMQVLDLQNSKLKTQDAKPIRRITFNEITKGAIQDAVKKPRNIDMSLVDAQQARRVLDRLVGYKLSPFLWKKVFKGLSAGRVQSVAVRLIVEREREITAFKPQEYWLMGAKLAYEKNEFLAFLTQIEGKKVDKLGIKTQAEAEAIINNFSQGKFKVRNFETREQKRYPYPPFTTSTLQQEAAKKLHFSAKQTMKLAQDLYEAGVITYMRTDSVNLSAQAVTAARSQIKNEFGDKYLPENPNIYKTKSKVAQEAHEAIRPTDIRLQESGISNVKFEEKHLRLYDLIRRRMLACQMTPAQFSANLADIENGKYLLHATGNKFVFDGFMKVWPVKSEEKFLPVLKSGDNLDFVNAIKEQKFTEPPARYSEASLIKTLEEEGIGRPSTYAPIISTIQVRGYVIKDKGRFVPTDSGFIVTDLLVENFPDIVNVKFTALMENQLDEVADNKLTYLKMLKDFYGPFEKNLEGKLESVKKVITEEKTDKICPKCGKPIIIKMGRFGKFYACSNFPECRHTEQIINKIGMQCPDCKTGDIIERKTRRGKTFWGCSSYPKCKWASWQDPRKQIQNSNDK